jgi:hypothetical protein
MAGRERFGAIRRVCVLSTQTRGAAIAYAPWR